MIRRALPLGVFVLTVATVIPQCGGCSQPEPTPNRRPDPKPIGIADLTRDYQTASAYTGVRVGVLLHPDNYSGAPGPLGYELYLWAGDRTAPHAVVFRSAAKPPPGTLHVVGTVLEPVRDGLWRSARCNYYVVVDDCTVTAH